MDFRDQAQEQAAGQDRDGALRVLWDRMLERSFDPADWFVDDDPPEPHEGD